MYSPRIRFFLAKHLHRSCHTQNVWKNQATEIDIPLSRESMKLSFGKLARFADGNCVAQLGDTSVLVTAVCKKKTPVTSFVPLLVDYRQKAAAAGRIPTNYLRREMGATDKEILTSRIIDRSLRPLFPKGFGYDTQLFCNLLAVDGVHDPDVISINAASAALALSDIPWNGPIGAVRVGLIDDQVIINPTRKELNQSSLNLVLSATEHNNVVMLEASADNVLQQDFMKALKAGVKETQNIIRGINDMQEKYGKTKREIEEVLVPSEDMLESANLLLETKIHEIFTDFSYDKVSRGIAVDTLQQEVLEKLKENHPDCDTSLLYLAINTVVKTIFRNLILETGKREMKEKNFMLHYEIISAIRNK